MIQEIKIGLLGYGTVGTGVVKILENNLDYIKTKAGVPIKIKKILVWTPTKIRSAFTNAEIVTDIKDLLNDDDIQIVVELIGGETPAKNYMLEALKKGKHVVTANKDVMSKYGKDLFEQAELSHVDLLFEASVGGGIPIIRPLKQCLATNNISEVIGIINGTTNYMLTKMTNEGVDFNTVLAEAQAKGYAEADPTADVEGLDAARKIAILASIAFGARVTVDDAYAEGIKNIGVEDIEYAKELGYVIKLVGIAKQDELGINVRVHPLLLPKEHPLASVNDVFNAIFVKGDAVGETMFYGRGAGEMPTASAVTADILDVARDIVHGCSSRILCTCFENKPTYPIEQSVSAYYIRLLVEDKPGVLAAIAGILGEQNVSICSVIQKLKVNNLTELVLITYPVKDERVKTALNYIKKLPIVDRICNVIRVEQKEQT